MAKLLKEKHDFLRDVGKLSKRERQKYLSECSSKNIHEICEAVYNVLKGHCPCKKKSISKKLEIYQKELKKVANPKTSLTLKRRILSSQRGDGIFSIIASTVVPFLVDLLAGRKR